ncbi:hypothetical protein CS542_05910 [Pedobacter sp. IW39]|nr:hypothetical protein CS542_05910 [Pedobacter sp. IW39]
MMISCPYKSHQSINRAPHFTNLTLPSSFLSNASPTPQSAVLFVSTPIATFKKEADLRFRQQSRIKLIWRLLTQYGFQSLK